MSSPAKIGLYCNSNRILKYSSKSGQLAKSDMLKFLQQRKKEKG